MEKLMDFKQKRIAELKQDFRISQKDAKIKEDLRGLLNDVQHELVKNLIENDLLQVYRKRGTVICGARNNGITKYELNYSFDNLDNWMKFETVCRFLLDTECEHSNYLNVEDYNILSDASTKLNYTRDGVYNFLSELDAQGCCVGELFDDIQESIYCNDIITNGIVDVSYNIDYKDMIEYSYQNDVNSLVADYLEGYYSLDRIVENLEELRFDIEGEYLWGLDIEDYIEELNDVETFYNAIEFFNFDSYYIHAKSSIGDTFKAWIDNKIEGLLRVHLEDLAENYNHIVYNINKYRYVFKIAQKDMQVYKKVNQVIELEAIDFNGEVHPKTITTRVVLPLTLHRGTIYGCSGERGKHRASELYCDSSHYDFPNVNISQALFNIYESINIKSVKYVSMHDNNFKYKSGLITPDKFSFSLNECAEGVHFFRDKQEAEYY